MDLLITTVADDDNPDVGDLKYTDGQITLTPDLKTSVAQHIVIRLRMFYGEWFLDTRQGVPYFEMILVKNPDLGLITSVFRAVILETPGVAAIDKIALSLDNSQRLLTVSSLQIRLDDGAVLRSEDFGALIAYKPPGAEDGA